MVIPTLDKLCVYLSSRPIEELLATVLAFESLQLYFYNIEIYKHAFSIIFVNTP